MSAAGWRTVPWRPGQATVAHRPRRRRWVLWGVAVAVVAYALAGGAGYDPMAVDYAAANVPPGPGGIAGTDAAGRSVATATAAGLRVSLLVAAAGALTAATVGVMVGVAAGVFGGWVDRAVVAVVDMTATVPHLVVGIVLVGFFPGNVAVMVAAIGVTHWTQTARVVRSVVVPLMGSDVIAGAWALGARSWGVARHFVVPAVAPQAAISVGLLIPHAVMHEATLSFLGVGLPPHLPSLGVQLSEAQTAVFSGAWWQLAVPAAALVTVTVTAAAWASRPTGGVATRAAQ